MKLKEIIYLLGFKPKPKTFGCEIKVFDLPKDGPVQYAQWLHPSETKKTVSQESVDELRRYLDPGDIAIDIGAHTGDTTIPIAIAVGKSGCVLALEPNKYVFPVLKKNSELNPDKTNIIPLMFAATPTGGTFEFEYSDSGFCNGGLHEGISKWRHGHAFKLEVEGRNLQSFLDKAYPDLVSKIRYVKVDAEGYDCTIIQSIANLISRYKPYIKAEVFKKTNHAQRRTLYDTILIHGYDIHKVDSDSSYLGELIGEEDMTRWDHFDIFCVPRESRDGAVARQHGKSF